MAPGRPSTCQSLAQENDLAKEKDVNTYSVEANSAAAALAAATAAVKPQLFSPGMIRLWIICLIGYTVATINGFDGSLMGSLNAMEQYQDTFGLNGAGASSGIVFIVYNLAQIVAFPLCGLLGDGLGRRKTIAIGCFIILIGTAIQTPAQSMGWFIGGRAVLGLGAAIAQAAAPVYIVEVAHPSFRGIIGGMYNNFWWVGNIVASWTTYGCNKNISSSWAWRIPTLVQCFLPAIVLAGVLFLPESPRWLIAHDRHEEAERFFAKYHADGNRNAPIVRLQIDEILEEMHLYRDDNPWWDFRELFNTRQARYRTFMVVCMAFFGQWSGNNVVSYFMPLMLKEGGITNTSTQLLLNAIYPISSMIASIVGAMLLDKVGRRKMLLGGLFGALGSYVMLTAFTAEAYINTSLIYGVIISIYLFGIFFAGGWTPLQSLYPTECLENRTRAKGAGMKFLFLNIANMTNTFGVAVGIDVIGWKLYLVYIGWLCLEIVVVYLFFVETAGKTLEELSVIFGAKNPVKTSLDKSELIITTQGYGAKIDVTKVA
ncbi:putative Major facilitator superfamily (MFS) profile domain-containing protein [Seiridium unicorne]|uniref:Major facilitator superfamily (MFS) profile domain-containing protein n=1 Tax=Seiridium unicorne TaxID=138068 RepID=A0ABR2UEQ2_9PEZI